VIVARSVIFRRNGETFRSAATEEGSISHFGLTHIRQSGLESPYHVVGRLAKVFDGARIHDPKNAAIRPGASLPPLPTELPVTNPPPEVHPLAAANRPVAIALVPPLEYYNYSVSALPPTLPLPNTFTLGALPQRLLPILAEKDPYAALGIRAGSFVLLPSIDLSGG
jgi:hypothetical protein